MAFMSLECIGIIDGQHFLVAVGHDDGLGALGQALLLQAAALPLAPLAPHLGVADVSVDGGLVGGGSYS